MPRTGSIWFEERRGAGIEEGVPAPPVELRSFARAWKIRDYLYSFGNFLLYLHVATTIVCLSALPTFAQSVPGIQMFSTVENGVDLGAANIIIAEQNSNQVVSARELLSSFRNESGARPCACADGGREEQKCLLDFW